VVDGLRIAYRSAGTGPAVVLLHGNPTSSYLWRDVLPVLSRSARCIAPDLVGMGHSDPLPDPGPDRYRFADHRRILHGLLGQLDLGPLVLVRHDRGGVLAVDWARRHPDAVRGIAYLETLVSPLSWSAPNASAPDLFRALRGPGG
jgi:haloalkane dehalogenase